MTNMNKSRFHATVFIALVAAASLVATAPAWAGPSATPAPIPSPSQGAYESNVATFAASHTAPAIPVVRDDKAMAEYNKALLSYWRTVPWASVFGQWGCSSREVTTSMQPGGATLGAIVNCGQNGAASNLAFAAATAVAPKSKLLASDPSLKQLYSASQSNTTSTAVQPYSFLSSCAHVKSAYICVLFNQSTLQIGASTEWEGSSSTTGHVRLGQPGVGNSCGLGTFKGNSPDGLLNPGDQTLVLVTMTQDSYYSARFYNESYYGQHCATF